MRARCNVNVNVEREGTAPGCGKTTNALERTNSNERRERSAGGRMEQRRERARGTWNVLGTGWVERLGRSGSELGTAQVARSRAREGNWGRELGTGRLNWAGGWVNPNWEHAASANDASNGSSNGGSAARPRERARTARTSERERQLGDQLGQPNQLGAAIRWVIRTAGLVWVWVNPRERQGTNQRAAAAAAAAGTAGRRGALVERRGAAATP